MALRQRTISVGNESETVYLRKRPNTLDRGGQYMYVIKDASGGRIEDPYTNKQAALREFRATVDQIRTGMQAEQQDRERTDGIDRLFGMDDDQDGGSGGALPW
jgi:hypothetical protein